MSTETEQKKTDEEVEVVTGVDGKTYRVLKNYVPPPPLPVTAAEEKMIDASIRSMAARFRREDIKVERPRFVCQEEEACRAIDRILADGMWDLRKRVPNDTAEKLFERLGKVSTDWGDDALAVGTIFIRYFDTMEAFVSYKRKFRGREREHCKYTKEEALEILRQRGLTRR